MRILDRPAYLSEDGYREFKSADECIEYERFIRLKAVMHKQFPHGSSSDTEVVNFILERWSELQLAMNPAPHPPQDERAPMTNLERMNAANGRGLIDSIGIWEAFEFGVADAEAHHKIGVKQ